MQKTEIDELKLAVSAQEHMIMNMKTKMKDMTNEQQILAETSSKILSYMDSLGNDFQ